jgi:hypothetical protein
VNAREAVRCEWPCWLRRQRWRVSSQLVARVERRTPSNPLLLTAIVLATATPAAAQAPPATSQPSTAQAPAQSPAGQTPPAATQARTFTAPAGLLFNTVRQDRVADFEKVIGYLEEALQKSTDATVRAQAKGWRVFKTAEPGPGGTVLFVFVIDPAVPSADYGLGRILADAFPDTAQLQEIWKLYTGAVTSGGTLLNLMPVKPGETANPGTPSAGTPTERPLPPDADPNRR